MPSTPQIQCSQVFLTYPKCFKSINTVRMALTAWAAKHSFQVYRGIIARETHLDGSYHLHIWLHFKPRMRTRRFTTIFDGLTGQHGNYQVVRKPVAILQYVTKDGDYQLIGEITETYLNRLRKSSGSSELAIVCSALRDHVSFHDLIEDHAAVLVRHHTGLKFLANLIQTAPAPKLPLCRYQLYAYALSPELSAIRTWININLIQKARKFKDKQLYIWSPEPNMYKTTLLLTLEQFYRTYHIPHENFDDLYFNKSFDLCVFDDVRGGSRPLNWFLRFLQGGPCTLRKKGSQYLKTDNIPVILTSNIHPTELFPNLMSRDPSLLQPLLARIDVIRLNNDVSPLVDALKQSVQQNGPPTPPTVPVSPVSDPLDGPVDELGFIPASHLQWFPCSSTTESTGSDELHRSSTSSFDSYDY